MTYWKTVGYLRIVILALYFVYYVLHGFYLCRYS